MQRTALIIFPDEWLQYSPTVINLHNCLQEDGYKVKIIAADNGHFDNKGLVEELVQVRTSGFCSYIARRLKRYKHFKCNRICRKLKRIARLQPAFDLVTGVDSIGYLAAKKYFRNVVFLSLEVVKDNFFNQAKKLGIDHLIIQTVERKIFLLGDDVSIPVSFIQNAPVMPDDLTEIKQNKPKKLLYLGKSDFRYGIEPFIESLMFLDEEYTLTLKGFKSDKFMEFVYANYYDLISKKRLLFDFDYVHQDQIIDAIKEYYIAFTAYDLLLSEKDFNYYSSPAGKLFNYYAAGLPVIGVKIPGLKSVEDYHAGKLLEEANPEQIAAVVKCLEEEYYKYANNAQKAAIAFDFRKAYRQFMSDYMQIHSETK